MSIEIIDKLSLIVKTNNLHFDKWYERLKFFRMEVLNLSQAKLANMLDLDVTALSRYERGRGAKEPSYMLKDKLKKVFGDEVAEWIASGNFSNGKKSKEQKSQFSQTSTQVISIPYFPDMFVSAGGGAYNYAAAPKQIAFTKDFLEEVLSVKSFDGLHLITAVGDSMEPSIEEGDKLLVLDYAKEGNAFIDGGVYVIAYASGVVVKRVYLRQDHIILHSDNPNISDEKLSGDDLEAAKVIGRVVGIVRKM